MTRKPTPAKPPPDANADATRNDPVALPRPRKRVTKAVAPAAPTAPDAPRKPAAAGPRPGPKRVAPAAPAATGDAPPRAAPSVAGLRAGGDATTRPAPTGVRAARAVVRPLTSIAPAAPTGSRR